jgi:hypothetical protein
MEFTISNDEKYLLISELSERNYFYPCYFENGFENDVFIDRKFGQDSLD